MKSAVLPDVERTGVLKTARVISEASAEAIEESWTPLPETERKIILKTARGIPETLAETYEGSSDLERETKGYSLFVFDVDKMYFVQTRKDRRFGESYRFISISSKEAKNEIEEAAMERDIILQFREPLSGIYGAALKDINVLLEVREILGDLEKKYS